MAKEVMHVTSKLECADYMRLIEQFNNLETEIITKLSMNQDIVVSILTGL